MHSRLFKFALTALTFTGLAAVVAPAQAAAIAPIATRIVHLDEASGQQPENIALEPDGSADLTFAYSGEIGRVTPSGQVTIIGRIPVPADGDIPVVHRKLFIGGIVRAVGGEVYVVASTGTAAATGVYRVTPGQPAVRVAALPPTGFLNGMAVDQATGELYIADSFAATIWRVSPRTGQVSAWATGALLAAPAGGFGANGIKIHHGAVWVSNMAQQRLIRIPMRLDGTAGTGTVVAAGLGPIDDFAFRGDTVFAAINQENRVSRISPDGVAITVLTAKDGLDNPTSVAVRGGLVYVANAAYFGGHNPNLLTTVLIPGAS